VAEDNRALKADVDQAAREEIRTSFSKVLNRHGYGFQYAVLRKCEEIAVQLQKDWSPSTWMPLVSEFPVEVQGIGTKTDFILR
jgi:hypothetical protein